MAKYSKPVHPARWLQISAHCAIVLLVLMGDQTFPKPSKLNAILVKPTEHIDDPAAVVSKWW
jgi:hypothetical protein